MREFAVRDNNGYVLHSARKSELREANTFVNLSDLRGDRLVPPAKNGSEAGATLPPHNAVIIGLIEKRGVRS
jgi:hypothetical protein